MVRIQRASPTQSAPSSPTVPADGALLTVDFSRKRRPRRPASAPPSTLSFDNQFNTADPFKPRRAPPPRVGDLPRPPPPLFRPTTFWRNTKRSGVTGASYSPSSYLIRRSTFIAAGLPFDKPSADLSAFCVESRVGVVRCSSLSTTISITLVLTAYTNSAIAQNFVARQDTPALPTTTSINWWPYPAYPSWGDPTATATTDPSTFIPVSSFIAAVSLTSGDAVADSSTSSQSTVSPTSTTTSPTSTGSIIHITALPPAPTPRRNLKRPTKSSFNIAYLAPLFAAGAAASKAAVRPFGRDRSTSASDKRFECGKRSRRRRKTVWQSFFRPDEAGQEVSAHRDSAYLTPQRTASHGAAERGDISTTYAEDDPFLPPPTDSAGPSSSPGNVERRPTSRSVISSAFGGDAFSEHEDDDVPYDTLRHKSIRRGILDRLQHGSRYRRGHQRADSDVRVDEVRSARGSYTSVSMIPDRTPSKASSTSGNANKPLSPLSNVSSGPGFRIVYDDAELSPTREGGMLGLNWTLPWIASPDKLDAQDKFTALPSRRSIADKRFSPSPGHSRTTSATSTKDSLAGDPVKPSLPRVDSSVLPVSPPRVTSPPLEAQLFFGTIPQKFGNTPQLDLALPGKSRSPGNSPSVAGSPRSKGNKLHSRRGPPLLPFPSAGSPFTNRLTKTRANTLATPESGTTSPLTATKAHTSVESFGQRHVAHNKVDEILAKSWSARDIRGEERVGSPTMFGAIAASSETPQAGIEQRLLG
ncbi:hypothetical protein NM688_g7617 [Phlebia brevispora]|uniref:Uncharacterized protein n=1 Tax=Phlebia brevispora TaxID=194682 RepID=A0ACC1S335_9APHY|nr:hypothetical protein NM688_g7617 [Phlebia brevispora]